jgi:hypothetical protein
VKQVDVPLLNWVRRLHSLTYFITRSIQLDSLTGDTLRRALGPGFFFLGAYGARQCLRG